MASTSTRDEFSRGAGARVRRMAAWTAHLVSHRREGSVLPPLCGPPSSDVRKRRATLAAKPHQQVQKKQGEFAVHVGDGF